MYEFDGKKGVLINRNINISGVRLPKDIDAVIILDTVRAFKGNFFYERDVEDIEAGSLSARPSPPMLTFDKMFNCAYDQSLFAKDSLLSALAVDTRDKFLHLMRQNLVPREAVAGDIPEYVISTTTTTATKPCEPNNVTTPTVSKKKKLDVLHVVIGILVVIALLCVGIVLIWVLLMKMKMTTHRKHRRVRSELVIKHSRPETHHPKAARRYHRPRPKPVTTRRRSPTKRIHSDTNISTYFRQ